MRHIQVSNRSIFDRGATVIEVVIALVLIPIITAAFAVTIATTLSTIKQNELRTAYTNISSLAMDWLERDVRFSKGFETTLPSLYNDRFGPNQNYGASDSWDFRGVSANSRVLILKVPSSTAAQASDARRPVFLNSTFGCGANKILNPTLDYYAIFFVRNNTLYKRYVTQEITTADPYSGPSTRTCDDQSQKQTCQPSDFPSGHPGARCQARDEIVATNVSQFSIAYYQTPELSSPELTAVYTSLADAPLVRTAKAISITLKIQDPINASISSTVNLKVTTLNS